MRVFLTGATGFIGSAIVVELHSAGHEVVGLARSDASAKALEAAGAQVHRGALDDVAGLRAAAENSDGVIHVGFIHDFSSMEAMQKSMRTDTEAIAAMGEALVGSNRPLVIASGTIGLVQGRAVTEDDPAPPGWPRGASEETMIALGKKGVRTSIIRLPPSVHSDKDTHGFIPTIIASSRQSGASAYVGEGVNNWSAVHCVDAARLFRLALEKAPAGSRLHGIGDEGVPTREIASAIARGLGIPLVSKPLAEAGANLGWLANFFAMDATASGKKTRELLGWEPAHPGLIADLAEGHYFAR